MRFAARLALLYPILAGLCLAANAAPRPLTIRGVQQSVVRFAPQGQPRGTVLFLPGDGGWRGFAITIAETMASWGYEVFGLDTRRYLEGFTGGQKPLSEQQAAADLRAAAEALRGPSSARVTIVGWSEGAGLAVLAGALGQNKEPFRGLVAIGLPEKAILGWRWQDAITWITKKDPDEPMFNIRPHLKDIAPLPFAMIQSSQDEWTSPAASKSLFEAAAEPKRLYLIESRSHRFDGNRDEFFRRLQEVLGWMNP